MLAPFQNNSFYRYIRKLFECSVLQIASKTPIFLDVPVRCKERIRKIVTWRIFRSERRKIKGQLGTENTSVKAYRAFAYQFERGARKTAIAQLNERPRYIMRHARTHRKAH